MYQLSKDGQWFVFEIKDRRRVLGLRELVKVMDQLGFALIDIEDGIVGLEIHGHRVAHYGVYKNFIYSK